MNLKTATLIAIVGIGLSLILSILNPYIQQALLDSRDSRGLSLNDMRFYLNTILQLVAVLRDGSIILFLVFFLNNQKQTKEPQ